MYMRIFKRGHGNLRPSPPKFMPIYSCSILSRFFGGLNVKSLSLKLFLGLLRHYFIKPPSPRLKCLAIAPCVYLIKLVVYIYYRCPHIVSLYFVNVTNTY